MRISKGLVGVSILVLVGVLNAQAAPVQSPEYSSKNIKSGANIPDDLFLICFNDEVTSEAEYTRRVKVLRTMGAQVLVRMSPCGATAKIRPEDVDNIKANFILKISSGPVFSPLDSKCQKELFAEWNDIFFSFQPSKTTHQGNLGKDIVQPDISEMALRELERFPPVMHNMDVEEIKRQMQQFLNALFSRNKKALVEVTALASLDQDNLLDQADDVLKKRKISKEDFDVKVTFINGKDAKATLLRQGVAVSRYQLEKIENAWKIVEVDQ